MNRSILGLMLSLACLAGFSCGGSNSEPSPAPGPKPSSPAQPAAPAAAPVPLASYKVDWVSNQIPSELRASQDHSFTVTLKNAGPVPWPSKGTGGTAINQVSIAYHWFSAQGGKPVIFEGHRTPLPHDIAPGETFTANNVVVTTPGPGLYRLQLTLVHEGVTWFEEQGANTLTIPVSVR
jgi:hypothetical protein